ncbi:hypothetical protein HDV00_007415 [Rhizophlyctis rosea]|nr:hypothetical protein HDV00_007415 [Rhizophlyctis rosea]
MSLSKFWEDLPIPNSVNATLEVALDRLGKWSSRDTLTVLAIAAAGTIPLVYYVYQHLDPNLKLMVTGEVNRAKVAKEVRERGPISYRYGLFGPAYVVWGEAGGKWLLQENKNNLFSG